MPPPRTMKKTKTDRQLPYIGIISVPIALCCRSLPNAETERKFLPELNSLPFNKNNVIYDSPSAAKMESSPLSDTFHINIAY